MQATMFRLDPELHKMLRLTAIAGGISMNDALKQAVEMWLKKHEGALNFVRARERAREGPKLQRLINKAVKKGGRKQ